LDFSATHAEPAFDLAVRKYRTYNAADGYDFQASIFGNGFEASRNLTREDLIVIREWIDIVLEASKALAA
jgi:hypothetical protein